MRINMIGLSSTRSYTFLPLDEFNSDNDVLITFDYFCSVLDNYMNPDNNELPSDGFSLYFYEGNSSLSGGGPSYGLGFLPVSDPLYSNFDLLLQNDVYNNLYLGSTSLDAGGKPIYYTKSVGTWPFPVKVQFNNTDFTGVPNSSGWQITNNNSTALYYYSNTNILYPLWAVDWKNGPAFPYVPNGYPVFFRKNIGENFPGKLGSLLAVGFDFNGTFATTYSGISSGPVNNSVAIRSGYSDNYRFLARTNNLTSNNFLYPTYLYNSINQSQSAVIYNRVRVRLTDLGKTIDVKIKPNNFQDFIDIVSYSSEILPTFNVFTRDSLRVGLNFSSTNNTIFGIKNFSVAAIKATPTPTQTSTNTPTPTQTQTPESTQTQTPTNTPTQTSTPTSSNTQTPTPSQTNTATPSNTPTKTPQPTTTQTSTPSNTPSKTPAGTPPATPAATPGTTPTQTPSKSPTATPGGSPTPTPTNPNTTPTQTPTPTVVATFDSNIFGVGAGSQGQLGLINTIEDELNMTQLP
jgi:hypothetical protein